MATARSPVRKLYKGNPVSPGVGMGRSCFCRASSNNYLAVANSFKSNNQQVKAAFVQLSKKLTTLIQISENKADENLAALFKAHKMICNELEVEVIETINKKQTTAIDAIEECFSFYADHFSLSDNNYFKGRADDFSELKKLLLAFIQNSRDMLECREYSGCEMGECALGNEHILITDELSANVVIRVSTNTKGIISDKGNKNCHAAVVARSLGIPVVSGIKTIDSSFAYEDVVLINGGAGEVLVNPEKNEYEKLKNHINKFCKTYDVVSSVEGFNVLADIDLYKDVDKAVKVKADGIGLYRTEFEMLKQQRALNLEEQYQAYKYVLEKMKQKKVYIRLLDVGSDKAAPWIEHEQEDNPALGCRGARYLLSHPELLQVQARAIVSASTGSEVNVIYPMITDVKQFIQLKNIFLDATKDIENTTIKHGIMFEVPSACLNANELYKVIDFGRIGSNDLVQYLFAHDRTSKSFMYYDMVKDPAIWKLISFISNAAAEVKKPIEICGMLLDFPEFIPELIEHRITTVSTSPENIGEVRKAARAYLDEK